MIKGYRNNLKAFRKQRRLTQAQISQLINCSRSYYTLVEQGKRNPTQEFWEEIQYVFMISDQDMWSLMLRDCELEDVINENE